MGYCSDRAFDVAVGDLCSGPQQEIIFGGEQIKVLGAECSQGIMDFGLGGYEGTIAVSDFNSDDLSDLAVARENWDRQHAAIDIYLGAGDAAFPNHISYVTGSHISDLAAGDVTVMRMSTWWLPATACGLSWEWGMGPSERRFLLSSARRTPLTSLTLTEMAGLIWR